MRAIVLHETGPAENLRLEDRPDLSPDPGQVRIAVAAAGVHLIDTRMRAGEPGPPLPPLPAVPGREVAGTVDRIGDGVAESWLGRRVVAHLGSAEGGYAEQAVVSVEQLFALPEQVAWADAIAAVGTGRTALGILELEPPRADDVVLVPSAAGGLGWLLAQSAAAAGARVVVAAGGPDRVARLAELSPTLAVDYRRDGWDDEVRSATDGVTLVYDGVGGEVGRRSLELLRPGGRMTIFGWSSGAPTRLDTDDLVRHSVTVGSTLGPGMAALPGGIRGLAQRSLDRVADGSWRPLVTTYPLDQAARAQNDLEQRRAYGKVVLVPARSDDAQEPVKATAGAS